MTKTTRSMATWTAVGFLGVISVGIAIAVTQKSANALPNAKTLPRYTITIQLPGNTGTLNSPQNRVLKALTLRYEKMHPNITVDWQPIAGNPGITQMNAQLVARASAHSAMDVVFEQYGPVNSGSLPQGILQNLKPYLLQKSPYAKGFKTWLATWKSSTLPYMKAPNGNIDILLGSTVATEILYNKADFAKAGIKTVPVTYAQWVADMAKLKRVGITPLMFGTGGPCNPSWYERKFQSALLHSQISKFDVNHQQILTGLDVAVGVKRGVISMKNPAYAEGWKLLGQLRPYMAPGQSSYDACSGPTQSSPPPFGTSTLCTEQICHGLDGFLGYSGFEPARISRQVRIFPLSDDHEGNNPLFIQCKRNWNRGGAERSGGMVRDITSGRCVHDTREDKVGHQFSAMAVCSAE
ncbi:MAG: extracellular solute-binding protein [Gammaproteobacteria bacterium]|nr:extracellular solute-binding protein [Gammaproteobacteria bacterium]